MKVDNLEDLYRLSPMQEGMLFHSLYDPESNIYFRQLSCTLRGDLNVSAFKRAWQDVMNRQPVLRTCFYWEELENPIQAVHRQVTMPLDEYDWRELTGGEQSVRFDELRQSHHRAGFDFSIAPLMRLALVRTSDQEHRFIWSYHHLLMDGWSKYSVLKDVFSLYESAVRGQSVSLKPARRYRDYIEWLQQQNMLEAEQFWRDALKGFTTPVSLAAGVALIDAGSKESEFREQQITLSATATASLQSLAREQKLTLNTLVQGAWALLLSRYSREKDVLFGATVSGRPAGLPGVESMVGVFINTIPVRVRVDSDDMLLPWLKKLQERQVEALQYEYTPLVQIHGWSEVPRSQPLFDSLVVFYNYPVDSSLRERASSLEISDISFIERNNYPLTLVATPGVELSLRIPYDPNYFGEDTIARMLTHLKTIMEGMTANPESSISRLPFMPESERERILLEFNAPYSKTPVDDCLTQRFEDQVARTPGAVAVMFEQESINYEELNNRANQLAHHLRAIGVGPEVRVGICVERSIDMILGLIAILKAGGVYLPLDPDYPEERLEFMLKDAAVEVLLTQHHLLMGLPAYAAASEVICIDSDWGAISNESSENLAPRAMADNTAYVIYTSGSTGKPKGVCVSHRAAVNHFIAVQDLFDLSKDDRVLQFASLNFDVSLEQIFPTLFSGAAIVLRATEGWDTREFSRRVEEFKITVANPPTAYWHQLVAAPEPFSAHQLRLVIAGGDVILPEMVRQWQQSHSNNIRLLNGYGPTEATISTTFFDIPLGFCEQTTRQRIPIGDLVGERVVYILDSDGELVPTGVAGEMHIGGPLLAQGYLNRPALTAEKFIPDTFSKTPGARLYKTGDLARFLPDGRLDFLGRADHQVKIRGFRIEPGEIESALSQHPNVREAVVLAREDEAGDKLLIAYLISNSDAAPNTGELRRFLDEKLPAFMIPSAFVFLQSFPLTPNGKLDRRALPSLDNAMPQLEHAFVAPRNPVEQELADIWCGLLKLKQVGVHDNFFELGGHSLSLTQLASRIRKAFQVEVPLRTLFETPTIEEMTVAIAEKQVQQQEPENISELLAELEEMSPDQVKELLEYEGRNNA